MTILRKFATIAVTGALVFTGASAASALTLSGEEPSIPVDLRLSATQTPADGTTVEPGDTVEITLELTNLDPTEVASSPQVLIKAGDNSVHWTASPDDAENPPCAPSRDGTSVQCAVPELAGRESIKFTVTGTVTAVAVPLGADGKASPRTATWSAAAFFAEDNAAGNVDPDDRNNHESGSWVVAETAPQFPADLELTKVSTNPAAGTTLKLGQEVEFTVNLENKGPNTAGIAYVDFAAPNSSFTWTKPAAGEPCTLVTTGVECAIANLGRNMSTRFTVKATVTSDATHLSPERLAKWTAVAGFKSGNDARNFDPIDGNNAISGSWEVAATTTTADLALSTVRVSPTAGTPLTPGQPVEVTVRLTNNGPATAGVAYVDIKAQTDSIIWTAPTGVGSLCNVVSGNIVCTARDLAAGASVDFTVKGTVTKDASHLVADGTLATRFGQPEPDSMRPRRRTWIPIRPTTLSPGAGVQPSHNTPGPTPSWTPTPTPSNSDSNHQNRHPVTGVETSLVAVTGALLAATGVSGLISLKGRRNR